MDFQNSHLTNHTFTSITKEIKTALDTEKPPCDVSWIFKKHLILSIKSYCKTQLLWDKTNSS